MGVQDEVNRKTWSRASARRDLGRHVDFLPGEREPFDYVREHLDRRPVLELGVGLGRTIAFTSALTDDYRAVDYLPTMVDACRVAHPEARVEIGDARTLDGIPNDYFGLVTFAWNGIDAVPHRDRAQVFRAVRRVLRPDGLFFFSTLNLDGPDWRERPWHVPIRPTRNPLARIVRAARAGRYVVKNLVNWLRLVRAGERGDGYRVSPLAAHDYGVLVHFTTLARQLDELADAGFARDARVYASDTGAPLHSGDDTSGVGYFHVVAAPTAG